MNGIDVLKVYYTKCGNEASLSVVQKIMSEYGYTFGLRGKVIARTLYPRVALFLASIGGEALENEAAVEEYKKRDLINSPEVS